MQDPDTVLKCNRTVEGVWAQSSIATQMRLAQTDAQGVTNALAELSQHSQSNVAQIADSRKRTKVSTIDTGSEDRWTSAKDLTSGIFCIMFRPLWPCYWTSKLWVNSTLLRSVWNWPGPTKIGRNILNGTLLLIKWVWSGLRYWPVLKIMIEFNPVLQLCSPLNKDMHNCYLSHQDLMWEVQCHPQNVCYHRFALARKIFLKFKTSLGLCMSSNKFADTRVELIFMVQAWGDKCMAWMRLVVKQAWMRTTESVIASVWKPTPRAIRPLRRRTD